MADHKKIDVLIAIAAFLIAATLCVIAYMQLVPMLLDIPRHADPAAQRSNQDGMTPRWSTSATQFGSSHHSNTRTVKSDA